MEKEKEKEKEKEHVYFRESDKYMEWLTKEGGEWLAKSESSPHTRFILKNHQCPGDIMMLAACVRDIKKWNPHFEIDIRTSCDAIFEHSPYITPMSEDDPSVRVLDMHYEMIHESNQNMNNHFIHGFIFDFNQQTGSSIKLTDFKPCIHLTDEEKKNPVFDDQPKKFVVLNSGGKTDYKTKIWWPEAWQEVVRLCKDIQFIQVGKNDKKDTGAGKAAHIVLKGKNISSRIDQTSMREMIRLIYQSVGTASVVTSVMHIAAAFGRRAVVVAGGHEPWWWERYPGHDYFHTIGQLECCKLGGCWKKECENKNSKNGHQKCLELIKPLDIANAIKSWFK